MNWREDVLPCSRLDQLFDASGIGGDMSKTRVLVLGGGMGSLAALMEMTSEPNWRDRFDITVLQQGWRLGGKVPSSRDPAHRQRNEEHGLHVLGGFYHNTFKMLRSCYDDWKGYFPARNCLQGGLSERRTRSSSLRNCRAAGAKSRCRERPRRAGQRPTLPDTARHRQVLDQVRWRYFGPLPEGLEVYGEPGQLFVDRFRETADAFEALDLRDADQSRLEEIIALVKPLELTVQQVPPEALLKPIDRIIPEDPRSESSQPRTHRVGAVDPARDAPGQSHLSRLRHHKLL